MLFLLMAILVMEDGGKNFDAVRGETDLAIFSSSCDRHGGGLQGMGKIIQICFAHSGVTINSRFCCIYNSSSLEERGTLVVLLPLWASTKFLAAVGFQAYSSTSHGIHEDDDELLHFLAEGQPPCIPLSEADLLSSGSHGWWRSRRTKWSGPRRRRGVSRKKKEDPIAFLFTCQGYSCKSLGTELYFLVLSQIFCNRYCNAIF